MLDRRSTIASFLAAAVVPHAARAQTPAAPLPRIDDPALLTGWVKAALAEGGAAERALEEIGADGRFSGVALAAVEGRPVLSRAFGLADRQAGHANTLDTRFNIASAGKLFTAVLAAQLVEQGRLSLGDTVGQHLPAFSTHAASPATIEQLLTHRSGLGNYFASPQWHARRTAIRNVNDYLALVAPEPLQFAPGSSWGYSNSGFVVLAAIIEAITRNDYYKLLEERVFTPAGMRKTGFPSVSDNAPDAAIPYTDGCYARPPGTCTPSPVTDARLLQGVKGGPAGGGYSTAGDLLSFVLALERGTLIRRQTLELFKAERLRMEQRFMPMDAMGLGIARLTIHGQPSWGHNGGTPGAQAQIDVIENAPIVLIALGNSEGGQRLASARLRRALTPPGWTPPAPQNVARPG